MKSILVPAHDTPLISFQLATRVGTCLEALGSEGLIYHTAELGMRGAGGKDRETLDREIDALGASLGFAVHRDSITLYGTCLDRHLEKLFGLAHDILTAPHFEAEEHEKLKRETIFELDEMRDNDAALLARYFNRHFHPGHIYCRTAIGTADSLTKLELENSRALYPRLFRQEDLVLGVAGAIDDTQINALASNFSDMAESTAIDPPSLTPPPGLSGRRLILINKPNRQQCQVAIGHSMPAYGSDDFDRLRIAEAAFGGMFTSRLMQEIRVNHGWSYGAGCTMYRALGSHALQVSMAPAAEVCALAITRVLEMIDELHDDGLKEEEFDFTRSYLVGSAAFSRATAPQRLARKVLEETYDIPKGYGDGFSERIQHTDRTSTNAAIQKWIHPKDLCVVVVASADVMRDKLEAIGFDSIEVVEHRSY